MEEPLSAAKYMSCGFIAAMMGAKPRVLVTAMLEEQDVLCTWVASFLKPDDLCPFTGALS